MTDMAKKQYNRRIELSTDTDWDRWAHLQQEILTSLSPARNQLYTAEWEGGKTTSGDDLDGSGDFADFRADAEGQTIQTLQMSVHRARPADSDDELSAIVTVLIGKSGLIVVTGSIESEVERLTQHLGSQAETSTPYKPMPLDVGVRLLQPITVHEYGSIERLLGLLWEGAAKADLSEGQIAQITAIHELITQTHRDTEANKTHRWKLVAVIGEGLKMVLLAGIGEVVGWSLIQVVQEMGWGQTVLNLKVLLKSSGK